jgi:ankyrin repeat protein
LLSGVSNYLVTFPLRQACQIVIKDVLGTAGADLNLRDLDGNTALHYAYACGSNQAMSALEGMSASSDITNNAGKTPFDVVGLIDSIAPIFK